MAVASDSIPNAGVHFPPPLLYVAGIAVGWMLQRWRPAPITPGPSTGRLLAAAVCVLAWLALFVGAFVTFRRAHTTLIPNQPATALATGGPYRLTRNPMYLSLVALYLGVMLMLNSWWPLLLLPVVVLVVDRTIIARE